MKKRLSCIFLIILVSSEVSADSFRCGRSLIKAGDSVNLLLKRCGEPVRKFSSKETIYENGRSLEASVSNWVFSRRSNKDMIISVRNGSVVKIRRA